MTTPRTRRGLIRIGLLAVVVCAVAPSSSSAAWLVYQNNSKLPISVQASAPNKAGQMVQGAPHPINPGGTASDQVLTPGTKTITVMAADRKKVLFSGTINFGGADECYALVPDPVKAGQPPTYKFVKAPLPAAMQRPR